MSRQYIDCREFPSIMNCSLALSSDNDNELLEASRAACGCRARPQRHAGTAQAIDIPVQAGHTAADDRADRGRLGSLGG